MKDWELAYKDYKDGMKYKEIAEKYGKSINTVKSWKSRYWNDITDTTDEVATKDEKVCTQKGKVAHKEEIPKVVIELNDNSNLTEQQKLFCLYYLQSFNATQSYIKAYKCDYDTAMVNASRLLRNAKVKEELSNIKTSIQAEQYFNIQDIIDDYARQWKADINDVVTSERKRFKATDSRGKHLKDENGNQIYSYYNTVTAKNSDEFDGQLVKEITQGRDGVSVKLWDKQKAMDALLKYHEKSQENDQGSKRVVIARSKRGDSDE